MSYLSSPETRSRAARLDRVLNDLLARTPEVEAAAVMSFDGLPMASAMPPALDEDRVAAMSAALLSLGERAAQGLGRGALNQIYIEGEYGTVFLVSARDEAVLMAVSTAGSKVGMMRYEVRQAADQAGEVLASASPVQDLGFDAGFDAAFDQTFDESTEPLSDEPTGQPEASFEESFGQPEPSFGQPEASFEESFGQPEPPFGQPEASFEQPFDEQSEPVFEDSESVFEPFESFEPAPESEPADDHAVEAHLLDEPAHVWPSYDVASVPAAIAATVEVPAPESLDDSETGVSQPNGQLPPGGIPFWV